MGTQNENNKRIAKNTALLYVRMLLLFIVNFYTTRVLLQKLGVDDFGLYNVIAGFVAMLGFMNQSMTNSIQRFLNYEFGKKNNKGVQQYFEASLASQTLLGVLLIILFETIGLWFLNGQMNISSNKILTANYVYQLSCASLIIGLLRAPYNAIIIAKEKMSFYAYISIIEAIAKLLIAYLIIYTPFEKLIVYSTLLFASGILLLSATIIYCKKIANFLQFRFSWNKSILSEMLSFSGWNLVGAASGLVKSQGINVLMNIFFNVAINAARGIAFQVLSGVYQFVANFQVAINPQIVQSYATGDMNRYFKLTYLSGKMSFFLMWIITLPIIVCINELLALWLGVVPLYTDEFIIIILFTGLIDSLGSSLSTSLYAVGKIRTYQIVVSAIKMLVLPISYVLYKMGFAPASSMYVSLCLAIGEQMMRVTIWCKQVGESPLLYIHNIVKPAILVIVLSSVIIYVLSIIIRFDSSLIKIIVMSLLSIIDCLTIMYLFGLDARERTHIISIMKSRIK